MKVVIDTKEDVHILGHIINMLHAISANTAVKRTDYDSGFSNVNSMFDTPSSSSPVPETPSGMFNMFDSSSSSQAPSSSMTDIPSIFDEPKKDDTNKTRDFIDSLQVY